MTVFKFALLVVAKFLAFFPDKGAGLAYKKSLLLTYALVTVFKFFLLVGL